MARSNQECGRKKFWSELSNNKSQSKSSKRKDIQCYKCGKIGNMKRDCPEKKKKGIKNKEGSSKSANVVAEEDSDSGDGDMLSVSSSSDHLTDS